MEKFISSAEKLAPCGSSQANESFNRTVCSKAPKAIHYSNSESLDFRVAVAVCTKNIGGEGTIEKINQEKGLSPGAFSKSYRRRLDEKRKRESRRSKTTAFKRNRLTGKKARSLRRALMESREGVTYQSGMDYGSTAGEDIDDPVPLPTSSTDTKVVIFDLETTGLGKNAEVVQIAAKFGDAEFNQYILPARGKRKAHYDRPTVHVFFMSFLMFSSLYSFDQLILGGLTPEGLRRFD